MPTEFSRLMDRCGLHASDAAKICDVREKTIYRWRNGETAPRAPVIQLLNQLALEGRRQFALPLTEFRYIDLFAGIGGFRRAFDSIGGNCVFTSEWDRMCARTYRENNPDDDHDIVGDIREFTRSEEHLSGIPQHDVLVAGFPCQPFSIAGVSKKNSLGREHGFRCDTQGTLFFDIAQIIDFHRPKAFLLENVRNLISHDKGNTFRIIRRTLEEELGYTIHYKVIDGSAWVPQKRKRILIVGFQKPTGFSLDDLPLPEVGEWPTLRTVLHNAAFEEEDEPPFTLNSEVADKYTLSTGLWNYLQEYRKKHEAAGNGFGFGLVGPDDVARTLSARYYKDGSEILVRRGSNGRARPRRLTPRECARLMGFDQPGQSNFRIPVSDTQAYKQFGNSVIVPMATAVAQHMKPKILDLVHRRESGMGTSMADSTMVNESALTA